MCRTANPCPPRYCEYCGSLIERTYGMSPWRYGRRRFCSHECDGAYRKEQHVGRRLAPIPPRRCKWPGCGALLVQRPGETRGSFRARKFCSATCLSLYRADWLRKVHVLQKKADPDQNEIAQLKVAFRMKWYAAPQMQRAVLCGTTLD